MTSTTELAVYTRDADHMGRRPALVLLPAFPFDHRMWEGVARRFEGIPVVAVDPPGFGSSPLPQDAPQLENYADYVAQAVRAEGVSRAVVCGNGVGGYVTLAMLERYPRLVAGVALIGTDAGFDDQDAHAARTEMAINALVGRGQQQLQQQVDALVSTQTREQYPDLVQRLKQWAGQAGDEAVAWLQRAVAQRPGRVEVLQRARIPGVVVRGEQDSRSTLQQADQMAKAVGATRPVSVPRAATLVPVEQPGVAARAIMGLYNRAAALS